MSRTEKDRRIRNPVAKNLRKKTGMGAHKDRKKEAKKEGIDDAGIGVCSRCDGTGLITKHDRRTG